MKNDDKQHQGEPVACASILVKLVGGKLVATVERFDGSRLPFGCLVDLYKYPPASADPSELRATKQALESLKGEANDLRDEVERRRVRGQACANKVAILRAQLAERDALLREIHDGALSGYARYSKIEAVLSASAESERES